MRLNTVLKESLFCNCNPGAFDNMPEPLFRLVCHCKTCQAFFGTEYNDECTFFLKDCPGLNLKNIEFKSYQSKWLPIKRGKCKSCGKVACCMAKLGPFAHLVMVSSELIELEHLPNPIAHVYYDRRVVDADDKIPKVSGHLFSQATIQLAVFKSLIKRRTDDQIKLP